MQRGDLRRALALVRRRTHRGHAVAVTLYERADCHLCADAFRALQRVALDTPLSVTRVDIDADAEAERRYALRVPVLRIGMSELDAAGLDDRAVAAWIRSVNDANSTGRTT